jgi:hypothetical protein
MQSARAFEPAIHVHYYASANFEPHGPVNTIYLTVFGYKIIFQI